MSITSQLQPQQLTKFFTKKLPNSSITQGALAHAFERTNVLNEAKFKDELLRDTVIRTAQGPLNEKESLEAYGLIKWLLKNGANPHITDKSHISAMEYAYQKPFLFNMLKEEALKRYNSPKVAPRLSLLLHLGQGNLARGMVEEVTQNFLPRPLMPLQASTSIPFKGGASDFLTGIKNYFKAKWSDLSKQFSG